MDSVSGEEGNFEVKITRHPRYVDVDKCIACGVCAEKCPKKVWNEYDAGLAKRKSIYVKYAQAVPLKYAIDDNCIYLTKGKCRACEKFCPADAIRFADKKKQITVNAGAILIASGTSVYDPATHDTYGYARSPNIVTSLEFERILAATGPFSGHLVRPSDHEEPKKIAWIQCVGSRDVHPGAQPYCSSVCCTYAIKEAIIATEHQKGNLDTAIFYIDIRTHGKDFERYYNRALDVGVRFIKSKISTVREDGETQSLIIGYTDETGRRIDETFDMVVLSVGFATSEEAVDLAQKLDIELDPWQLAGAGSFEPVRTSRPGVFVCGTFESPKDIPRAVIQASASAAMVESALAASRWSLTQTQEAAEEIDVSGEPARIGVFVCSCGTNIAAFLDVSQVVEYAKTLPDVVFAENNLFACSQDTQETMTQTIKDEKLNRIVVAACTPRTHEPLFQETILNAGVNKYLFEMANIRNQCSWVHSDDNIAATQKAKDLVRMAVSKVGLLSPLADPVIPMTRAALVIGAGLSGIIAAKNLGRQGYATYLVEKGDAVGGQALNLHETWQGENVRMNLTSLINDIESDPNVHILTNAEVKAVNGFVGNFQTTVASAGEEQAIDHGVAIIATGAEEFKPDQYLYGKDPRVVTGMELDRKFMDNGISFAATNSAVFIQCVGSRIPERPYCSKVCCTQSVKNALKLKTLKPKMDIFILYRDMRTYSTREGLYREAREKGVVFIRYDAARDLTVTRKDDSLRVRCTGYVLQRELEIRPDMLVLASAIVPPQENAIARLFKVPQNDDGFFVEAHVKLQPIDFSTKGVFVCGLAHSPKPMDEAIAQGLGAASRAGTFLSRDKIRGNAIISRIDPQVCWGCGKCVGNCSYQAIELIQRAGNQRVSQVQDALCTGCGACAAICPTGAASVSHFNDREVLTMLDAL